MHALNQLLNLNVKNKVENSFQIFRTTTRRNPSKFGWNTFTSIPSTIWNAATNKTKNLIFPHEQQTQKSIASTTVATITATTLNPFWSEWSATQPNDIIELDNNHGHSSSTEKGNRKNQRENLILDGHYTTTERPKKTNEMLPWLQDVLNEYSSTTEKMPSWMHNVLNEQKTTTSTQMPPWMRDILNQHDTSTESNIRSTTHRITTTVAMPSWMQNVLDQQSTTPVSGIPLTMHYPSTTKMPSSSITFGRNTGHGGGEFIDLSSFNSNRYIGIVEALSLLESIIQWLITHQVIINGGGQLILFIHTTMRKVSTWNIFTNLFFLILIPQSTIRRRSFVCSLSMYAKNKKTINTI